VRRPGSAAAANATFKAHEKANSHTLVRRPPIHVVCPRASPSFSGIHGNLIAADAALADVDARGGADEYLSLVIWLPSATIQSPSMSGLTSLPNFRVIQANTVDTWSLATAPFPPTTTLLPIPGSGRVRSTSSTSSPERKAQ
jgi:hypothetical protein